MKDNSIRRAVREGRAALGTGLKEFASRGVPWIIEASGFDYCAIDHEHGAFDMATIANLASWFQATNVTAIVRIHKSFAHLIPGILDQGMESGVFRRMDPLVAARMLSALFVTHGLWYHQRQCFKSIQHVPADVMLEQIRDFFLTALRPDSTDAPSIA